MNEAIGLQRAGRFPDAERACREALSIDPNHADANYLLGLLLLQQRRVELAVDQIKKAIALRPDVAEFHGNLGFALRAIGRLDEAAVHCERAIALQPNYPIAYVNLGSIRRQQGRFDDAVRAFQSSLRVDPNLVAAWMNLGNALRDQGKPADALAAYQRAAVLEPSNPDVHFSVASMLGQLERPIEATASFQTALRLNPRHLPALMNYGLLLRTQNDFEGAVNVFMQALQIDPNNADVHERLARALFACCRTDEAMKHYEQAYRLAPTPHLRMAIATLIPPVYRSIEDVSWWRARLEREIAALHAEGFRLDITNQPPPTTVYLPYQGLEDRDIAKKIAELCSVTPSPRTRVEGGGEGVFSQSTIGNRRSEIQTPHPDPLPAYGAREPVRKRIGFISTLFKDQTVGLWMQGIIAKLSREKFEVIVLSNAAHDDGVGRFIRQHADRYVVLPSSLPAAREAIAGLDLDVLVYADIGMAPWTQALAHSRLAPVQCVTVGHPITTGIATIDYYISSDLAEANDAQTNYTENLVRLPSLPVYYYRPEPPKENVTRRDFDLPDDAHLYGCLQAQYKLHPSFDEAMAGILRADPQALILLSRGGTARGEDVILDRIRKQSPPDVIERVRFMPTLTRDRFRGLTALCDVLLAPFPFGAGDSSMEGFALNLPVVTLPTPYLKGRLTYAMYKLMKIDDCVASDMQDYVRIAARLGTDRDFNRTIREKIRTSNHVLYENPAGIRDIEEFLTQLPTSVT